MAASGFHTGEHTSTCICPCTTYKHEYTHAHHTFLKMGKSHRNYVKKQKAVFSATDLMPACPLEGVSGDKMSQFYHAFC